MNEAVEIVSCVGN